MAECALLAHHRNLTNYDQLVRSALGLGVALAPNQCKKFGKKNMLFESVFGRGKHCCCLVCCHGHGVAHSLSVSTSLSFVSREYAEAFMGLCNCGTKGTEELGNARSNKNRMGVQDVKEYFYSQCQIGLNWVMFQNI